MPFYFELIIRSKVALVLTPSEKYKKEQICIFNRSVLLMPHFFN